MLQVHLSLDEFHIISLAVVPYISDVLKDHVRLTEWVTKMKPDTNSFEVHPQLTHNEHLVDVELLVGAGLLWPQK